MRLYKRKAELVIYTNDGTNTTAVDLSDLDFEFTVTAKSPERKNKKNVTSPVTAFIRIKKLSDQTRDKISASETGAKINFGYDGEMFKLFEGTTINVTHEYDAPDWSTNIYASHLWEAYKHSYFSKSYTLGTPVRVIIDDVIKSFGIPFVNLFARADTILAGTVFDGESKDVMDKLARDYDLSWEIANNTITVTDSLNPPLVDMTIVVILGQALLDGPIIEESLKDENQSNEKVVRRIHATSLLLPQLYPSIPVQFQTVSTTRSFTDILSSPLKTLDMGAIYICDEVIHRGSNMTIQCVSEITTKEETL